MDPRYPVDEVVASPSERMVYHVRSASRPKIRHRVDLLANAGAGECSCPDFSVRRLPAILAGQPIGTRRTLCRHGILARRHFLNALLQSLAKTEEARQ